MRSMLPSISIRQNTARLYSFWPLPARRSRREQRAGIQSLLRLVVLSVCVTLLVGCAPSQQTILGIAPANAAPVSIEVIAAISGNGAAKGETARQVTVQGEMVEKCPVAGCWFKLRDKTGVIRVDTKAAGFVVSDVPLHTQMTVQGKIVPGTESQVAATGLRY